MYNTGLTNSDHLSVFVKKLMLVKQKTYESQETMNYVDT